MLEWIPSDKKKKNYIRYILLLFDLLPVDYNRFLQNLLSQTKHVSDGNLNYIKLFRKLKESVVQELFTLE